MRTYAAGSIRGTWNRLECHIQALSTIPRDNGNVSRCYREGRPRDTTPKEGRYLAVYAKKNRRSTVSELSHQLPVRQFQGRPCTDD
ncbi:uncharacterized protein TNCV_4934811 [Trichonephila clavipes]|uniref:Uncharacterized protein n=1 Tax=Trichonephila clavipes TaxID=2585209 RepID=A0A8X6SNE1_TRICX|nr:uncharacterized protein TNCV_4934811 [Trichonephila clavipes]